MDRAVGNEYDSSIADLAKIPLPSPSATVPSNAGIHFGELCLNGVQHHPNLIVTAIYLPHDHITILLGVPLRHRGIQRDHLVLIDLRAFQLNNPTIVDFDNESVFVQAHHNTVNPLGTVTIFQIVLKEITLLRFNVFGYST
jgi:hypothetical protein